MNAEKCISCEKSFGIEVAKLADLPDTVVARSRVIIDELETAHHHSHEALEKSPVAPFGP